MNLKKKVNMSTVLMYIAFIIFAAWLFFTRLSTSENPIINPKQTNEVPQLYEMINYSKSESDILPLFKNENLESIVAHWNREPNDSLSGLSGDVWIYNHYRIILYYNDVGYVSDIKIDPILDDEYVHEDSKIQFNDDGTATITFHPLSSYIGFCNYEIKDDEVIFTTIDTNERFVFDFLNNTLRFNKDESNENSYLYDKDVFTSTKK